MKRLLVLFVLLYSCGTVGQQDVQTGIGVAQDIFNILSNVLKPAVDSSFSLCDELTKESSSVREKALFECAVINDAWLHANNMSDKLKIAIDTNDSNKIKTATVDLENAVNELKSVLLNSSLRGYYDR